MAKLSVHAERRSRQRGIKNSRLHALLENADVERPLGGNCWLLKVSHRLASRIRGQDGLAKLAVVYSYRTDTVVTVLRAGSGQRGRRYRRGG